MTATQKPAGPARILETKNDGWRIRWREDGVDYPHLLAEFRAGRVPATRLTTGSGFREVYRLETTGRRYVVKRDWEVDPRPEKKLWDWLAGTPYARLLKLTNRAVGRGCRIVQDVYLVAERLSGGRCLEAWMVAEYVEGTSFVEEFVDGRPAKVGNFRPWIPAMAETLEELHNCGLASNDFHPGNFILTDQGLKIIDLSLDSPVVIGQANDALTMLHFFKVRPPLKSPWRRLVFELMRLRRRQKNFFRRLRSPK